MSQDGSEPMGTVFVLYPELRTRHGIPFTRVGLNRIIKRGDFPAPVKIAAHRIAWRLDEIEQWKATRQRQRPQSESDSGEVAANHRCGPAPPGG